jgi:hypothetical protein
MNKLGPMALVGGFAFAVALPALADSSPINILFVGNSYTHGRYTPVLNYNAGYGSDPSSSVVHDLLCMSASSCGVEGVAAVVPTSANTPGNTLSDKLAYLQANPSSQYTEVGPFGGVAGVFLQFTKESSLNYNVSLIAVSSATLTGYANNSGNEAGDLSLITNPKYSQVVLQDQTFQPLPTTITVNGQSVPTRGNPTSFNSGVTKLVNAISAADTSAGVQKAAITLYQTPPLAAYGYTSSNPNAPIFGSSTMAQQNGNRAYAPYIGAANPIAAMALDLHNAYVSAASTYNAANPGGSHVSVALAGDAWVTAINLGAAQQNPFLVNEPAGQVDLWDSDPLLSCCTTPIGYHPSVYGDYLNALVLFGQITGINPELLATEFDPTSTTSAAYALGIVAPVAWELAVAAEDTLVAAAAVPEPAAWALFASGLCVILAARRRPRAGS